MPKCSHGCFSVNLLHIFRTPFPRSTSGWLLPQFTRLIWPIVIGKFEGKLKKICKIKQIYNLQCKKERSMKKNAEPDIFKY